MDEDVWKVLEVAASQTGCTISDLVRQAVREKYAQSADARRQAFQSVAGIWARRDDLPSTETYIRKLRKDSRRRKALR